MQEENILQKPPFFQGTVSTIFGGIEFVFGLIPNFISSITEQKVFNIPLNWLLLFLTTLICILFYISIYVYRINKFYKEYTNQFKKREEEYKSLNKKCKNLDNENSERETKYNNLLREYNKIPLINKMATELLKLSVTTPTVEEVKYIKKVMELLGIKNDEERDENHEINE